MSAKEIRFSNDARDRMLRGVELLNNAVKVTLGPKAQLPSFPEHRGDIMSITKKLAVLREHHYGLDKLPETIRVPALGERRDETVKPVGAASIDDLAFALIGLNERASALYREIDAVRTLHDEARKAGALGADVAIDALIAAKGGK